MRSRLGQAGGSKLLEFVWVVVVVGVLSSVGLKYMLHYIEVAEKSAMESTVVNMRSALRLRLSEALISGDSRQIDRLAMENPINWLQEKPPNYVGEFDGDAREMVAAGKWYYDRTKRELVYLVDNGREFTPDANGQKRVRLQVSSPNLKKVAKETQTPTVMEVVGGISLVLVERYEWEFK